MGQKIGVDKWGKGGNNRYTKDDDIIHKEEDKYQLNVSKGFIIFKKGKSVGSNNRVEKNKDNIHQIKKVYS